MSTALFGAILFTAYTLWLTIAAGVEALIKRTRPTVGRKDLWR